MTLEEIVNIIIALSNNIYVLLVLVFLYAATNYEINRKKRLKSVIAGLIIGGPALFVMSNPFILTEGIIFDTRTILFSISGLFFGPIPTIIAALIGVFNRLFIGGAGVVVGVLTIVISAGIGLSWNKLTKKIKFKNNYLEYYIFGLIVHLITISLFTTLPNSQVVMLYISIPFIILFPVATMFIGVVIHHQKVRISLNMLDNAQRLLIQSSIDSTKTIEIYALDKQYEYLTFNMFHQNQMKNFYGVDIKDGDSFIDLITDDQMKERLLSAFAKAFKGQSVTLTTELETTKGKFLEEYFTPIYEGREVVGVTVFVRDISEQKAYEASILKLSYYDSLTNQYNRRFFQEKIKDLSDKKYRPLTVVSCDVNGLKLINDAFGHRTGDEILVKVGEVLSSILGDKAFVCRIGGDEFIMLLPNTSFDTASNLMERVQAYFESNKFNGLNVSISYGLATKKSDESVDDVVRLSEEQMYKHKLFEITSHRSEFIKTILNTLHEKNPREEEHSQRVSFICTEIGKRLNMKKNELNLLIAISSLHDIGKIAIDEAILNKPGKLTESEWEIVKRHPEIGYRIISTAPEYSEIAHDILSHHEKYDGTGYPRGIKGEDIPIRARIVAIADAYDAMISKRTYREPFSKKQAIEEIKRCSGSQFDPHLVDIFLDVHKNHKY